MENCSLATVKYHISRSGLSGKHKITKEEFDKLKELIEVGIKYEEISKIVGISISTIKRYKNKNWTENEDGKNKINYFNRNRRKELKLKAVNYKGGSCEKCGYNKCLDALTFHHINPAEKDFQISEMCRKWETVKNELDKCILVCSNCHLEIHSEIYNGRYPSGLQGLV